MRARGRLSAALCALAAAVSAAPPRHSPSTAAEPPGHTAEELAGVRQITELDLSPDGCLLAFAADISGYEELWTVPACEKDGSLPEFPRWPNQLSSLEENVTDVHFSPDGLKILFASDHGGDERRGFFRVDSGGGRVEELRLALPREGGAAPPAAPRAMGDPAFSPDGKNLAFTAEAQRPYLFQLFVADIADRRPAQLTREPVNIRGPVWSRDASRLAVTRTGDDQRGSLLIIGVSSDTYGRAAKVESPAPGGIVYAQAFSPDGRFLLVTATNKAGMQQLGLAPADGGKIQFIGPEDREVERALWHSEAGIFFVRNENGGSALYRMAATTDKPELLLGLGGRMDAFSLDKTGSRLAYLWEETTRPAEAWVLDLKTRKRSQLTRSLAGGVDPATLSAGKMIAYPSFDGAAIHALYYPPRSPRLGSPPPLVVWAHGGPDLQTRETFDPLLLLLADAGFAVLAPNYRGSSGYGVPFRELNHADWGGGDLQDIIFGVRHMGSQGLADPKRAGIVGESYGGYMTLTALAKSSDVWSAGAEAYGMADLALDYDLSKDRFAEWYRSEMGAPESQPELFRDRSPVHFLDHIRAPLLIFQGANDTNVPRAESDRLYEKLLDLKVPAELVVYPDEGHGFTRRKNLVDYYGRTAAFFEKHLAPRP